MKKTIYLVSTLLLLTCCIPLTLSAQYIQFGADVGASYYKSNDVFASMDLADPYAYIDYNLFLRWQSTKRWALEVDFGDYIHRKYDETYSAEWQDGTGTYYTNNVRQKTTISDYQWNVSLQYKIYAASNFNLYVGCSFNLLSESIAQSETWYHVGMPNTVYAGQSNAHFISPFYGALLRCSYSMSHSLAINATCQYRTKWSVGYPLYSSGDKEIFSIHTTPNAFYTLNFGICYSYNYSHK